ncbi:MAG: DUF4350 domain-containing protein [Bacteroidales bacterium]
MKKSDIILFSFLFIIFFFGAIYFTKNDGSSDFLSSSSYNTSTEGTKAFYTLLEKLGCHTTRHKKKYKSIPNDVNIFISVNPNFNIKFDEIEILADWVSKGNVLILIDPPIFSFQKQFNFSNNEKAQKFGNGYFYYFPSTYIISNYGMKEPKNAMRLLNIISKHYKSGSKIAFDEYYHGYKEDDVVPINIGMHIKVALAIAFVSLIMFIYSKAVRFGEIRSLGNTLNKRPAYEYVQAVGKLYEKTKSVSIAAEIVSSSFINNLCRKLGIANYSNSDLIYTKLKQTHKNEAEKIKEIIEKSISIIDSSTSNEKELVDLIRDINQLEKELNIAGN